MMKNVGWDEVMREKQIMEEVVLVIRKYEQEKDKFMVKEMERKCDMGYNDKMSLFSDDLGDPTCRVRSSPVSLMLVAVVEIVGEKEIVGLVRGCIKTVTCGKKLSKDKENGNESNNENNKFLPVCTKLGYILGLRVSTSHRRMGIGLKMVNRMEDWFRDNAVEYSYIATEKDNEASVKLFTERCGYSKFRTPSILVQPVYAHKIRVSKWVKIFKISTSDAEKLYYEKFRTTEFFPRDINSILNNKLNLGTFVAVPNKSFSLKSWPGTERFLSDPPESWTILSVWNVKEVFMLEVRGASLTRRALAKTTRVIDRAFPWLGIPSIPEIFKPFGSHFLYGLGGEGPESIKLMKALCGYAHNLAKERGCRMVATEVSSCEPLRIGIPHWKRLSYAEDIWCIKKLREDYSDGSFGDWTKSCPSDSIFVDPREL